MCFEYGYLLLKVIFSLRQVSAHNSRRSFIFIVIIMVSEVAQRKRPPGSIFFSLRVESNPPPPYGFCPLLKNHQTIST